MSFWLQITRWIDWWNQIWRLYFTFVDTCKKLTRAFSMPSKWTFSAREKHLAWRRFGITWRMCCYDCSKNFSGIRPVVIEILHFPMREKRQKSTPNVLFRQFCTFFTPANPWRRAFSKCDATSLGVLFYALSRGVMSFSWMSLVFWSGLFLCLKCIFLDLRKGTLHCFWAIAQKRAIQMLLTWHIRDQRNISRR